MSINKWEGLIFSFEESSVGTCLILTSSSKPGTTNAGCNFCSIIIRMVGLASRFASVIPSSHGTKQKEATYGRRQAQRVLHWVCIIITIIIPRLIFKFSISVGNRMFWPCIFCPATRECLPWFLNWMINTCQHTRMCGLENLLSLSPVYLILTSGLVTRDYTQCARRGTVEAVINCAASAIWQLSSKFTQLKLSCGNSHLA